MLDDWAMSIKTLKKRLTMALIARRVIERARVVHCAASGELEESAKWFPKGRGRVVPLVFDLEPFRTLPGPALARERFEHLRGPGPHLLFLSRLVPNKGADVLIEAVARLGAQGHACTLTIAGTGDPDHERSLRSAVEASGLGDRTALVGHIAGPLKISLFQACDLFILPTVHENFGFATIEALAAARPAITTPGTKIWRELQEGGGALITDGRPTPMAEAIASLLADPRRRELMGASGRRWAFDFLHPDRLLEQYESLYDPAAGVLAGAAQSERHIPATADT
jgi:glycosyltransferase involved in cell wall biosynthesis